MTLIDDRPPKSVAPPARPTPMRASSPTASWAFASRLARREVGRRPGRTLLVMLLIAVPVIGMTLGSILMRTNDTDNAAAFARSWGTADLVAFGGGNGPAELGGLAEQLPPGTRTAEYVSVQTPIRAEVDGVVRSAYVELTDADLTDPIVAPTIEVRRGRVPSTSSEVMLSENVAKRFAVDVGDSLQLLRPELRLDVVGIGRDRPRHPNDFMIVPGLDRDLLRPSWVQYAMLIDLPAGTSNVEIEDALRSARVLGDGEETIAEITGVVRESGVWFESAIGGPEFGSPDETTKQLAWGWVAGVVAFVAVGIVIAAAFATSARRQLVTIGQLSSNGASQGLVRRTMGLQGMWSGVLGGALGLLLAVGGSFVAHRFGLLEWVAQDDVAGVSIAPLHLVVIWATAIVAATVAALIPARSAARIPVLSALAGRRPIATPPRWMAPTGVALFLGGLFLLGGAASTRDVGDFTAMLAVIGSLGVVFGIVCASPLIVGFVGKVGSRGGGVVRLASRSLDRSRARSAAVLTAIAVVGALGVAGATAAGTAADADSADQYVPNLRRVWLIHNLWLSEGAVEIEDGLIDQPARVPTDLPDSFREGVERALPDLELVPITEVIDDPFPFNATTGETVYPPGFDRGRELIWGPTVADSALLANLDLSAEQQRILDDVGVIAVSPWASDLAQIQTPNGFVDVDLTASRAAIGFVGLIDTEEDSRRANEIGQAPGPWGQYVVVSPAFVEEHGLTTGITRYVGENPEDLTSAQRDAINDLQDFLGDDAFVAEASAPGIGGSDSGQWYADFEYPDVRAPWALIQALVALAVLAMVLLVVAIGLSLAATESRDERDVLHAVGAAPRTLRRVAAAKAWVLVTGAAVVAIPAGYITVFVVARATDQTAPVPFGMMFALLVMIPLMAAGAALATSAIAQRFKPVTYSTFTSD